MQRKAPISEKGFNRKFEGKNTKQPHMKRNIALVGTGIFMILLLAAGTVVTILRLFQ